MSLPPAWAERLTSRLAAIAPPMTAAVDDLRNWRREEAALSSEAGSWSMAGSFKQVSGGNAVAG
jgi:hypothetical protein